jgi:hypothetical protein
VISSTAAVSQLLGQAITIFQKIQEARAKVHSAPDRVDRYKDQLDSLLGTLRLVQDERELQTPAVKEQLEVVIETGKELKDTLDDLAAQQAKSKAKQFVHAFASGNTDEKGFDDIWDRLDRAKADLTTRILTVHVGLSGTMRDGFAVAWPVVQRVDRNVQRVLSQRLAIAARLEGRQSDQDGKGFVILIADANSIR